MEFSITPDMIPPITESNLEDFQRQNLGHCPQCLIDIINFVISILTFVIFVALPLVEIVIGISYINDCSMNHNIPIYLIITGSISLIISSFALLTWIFIWPTINDLKVKTIKSIFSEIGIFSKLMLCIAIFFILFGLAWFIVGNIWIFSGRPSVQYTNPIGFPNTYCNRVVYLTGFWSIIIKYVWIWIIICRVNCSICSDTRKLLINYNQNQV